MSTSITIERTQHLIDPEVCIRCNTCEETCPVDAITHDSRNYVVDAAKCNLCMACVSPCPTGSIDNWRLVPEPSLYSLAEQLQWDELPAPLTPHGDALPSTAGASTNPDAPAARSARVAPRSASAPVTNLYGANAPLSAVVAGNFRITDGPRESDTHHIVLDFGEARFPLLEGQSLGIIAPGQDGNGRAHSARQYSIASPRDGERPGYNNASLTVKRVTIDHAGAPTVGVCSNYLCDLKKGDRVNVIGPFGTTFLMPDHADAHLLMICTGTGSAPMRAMTERRRRLRASEAKQLSLFFGARTPAELPYFGPLSSLPSSFIDVHLAFSRAPEHAKQYVQDAMQMQASAIAKLLALEELYIYVCGLKAMEDGVLTALEQIATGAGLSWSQLHERMRRDGRIHLETY